MIRIDSLWLAVEPMDMRAGAERLLASVVQVNGRAQAHHGYLFANARTTRIKLLVHDGFGVWCAARRLNAGRWRSEQPIARLTNRRRGSAPSVLDRGRHAVEPVCPRLHHRSTHRQMIGVVVAVEAGLHVVTGGPSCCALRCSPLGRPGVLTALPLAVPHRSPGCRE